MSEKADQYRYAFDSVRFYISPDCLRMVYYNPDSESGGQLVENQLSLDAVTAAIAECKTEEEFWNRLDERAVQYLIDIDTPDFAAVAHSFAEAPWDFYGQSGETMAAIREWVSQRCAEMGAASAPEMTLQ